jgi:dihydrofolate synthase/folylpolyglutamate synthase
VLTHPVLTRLIGAGVRLGLERVRGFLEVLGAPQRAAPVLHVAGTNGKGSVCAMLTAALKAHGLTVGTYISPHLQHVNERIAVDGVPISDMQLSSLLEEIERRALEWVGAPLTDTAPLTYYEAMTAAAFLHFARAKVDVMVIEVGLGGRLDATNVVDSAVTAIVSVGLDHTAELGPDVGCIAGEKAGILREGVPMVLGPLPRQALRVVRPMAGAAGAPLVVWGEDFEARGTPQRLRVKVGERVLTDLRVPLTGPHQVENAGVAVAMLVQADGRLPGFRLDPERLRAGLAMTRHPGRMEWLTPELLVDGAHNEEGARRLAEALSRISRVGRRTLVLGVSDGKDIRSIAAALAPQVDRVFTTRCAHPRAVEPGAVAEALVGLSVPVMPAGSIEEALPLARAGEGLVIVAGSLFLVGAVRDLLGR